MLIARPTILTRSRFQNAPLKAWQPLDSTDLESPAACATARVRTLLNFGLVGDLLLRGGDGVGIAEEVAREQAGRALKKPL